MPKTRLVVKYVASDRSTEHQELIEWAEREFTDTVIGARVAKRFFEKQDDKHGGARLFRQSWNPRSVVDPPVIVGDWEDLEEWNWSDWVEPYQGICS
jgi:hypothetical protein